MGREPLPKRFSLTPSSCDIVVLCGISTCFQVLSPSLGQVIHVLLTRAPLRCQPKSTSPFDLHVLGTPPAFVLSQDQTLELNPDHLRSISIPQALVYFFWPLTLVFSLAGPSNLLDRFLNYLLIFSILHYIVFKVRSPLFFRSLLSVSPARLTIIPNTPLFVNAFLQKILNLFCRPQILLGTAGFFSAK